MIRARVLFPEKPPEHEPIRVAWAEVRYTSTRLTVFLTTDGKELRVSFTAPNEQTPVTTIVIPLPPSMKKCSYGSCCGPLSAYSDLVRVLTPQALKEQMEYEAKKGVEVLGCTGYDDIKLETPTLQDTLEETHDHNSRTGEALREFHRTYSSNRYNCRTVSVYPASFVLAGVLSTRKPSVDRTGFALLICHPLTRKALREGNATGKDMIADYPLQSDRENVKRLIDAFSTLKKTLSAYAYSSHLVKKYRKLLDNLNQSRKPVIVQCRYRPEVIHMWTRPGTYPMRTVIAPIPVEVTGVAADGVDVQAPPDLLDCLYVLGESVRFMAHAVNGITPHPMREDVSEEALVAVACRQLEYVRYPPHKYLSESLPLLLTTVYPAVEVLAEINGYRRAKKVCRLAGEVVRRTILSLDPHQFSDERLLEILEDTGTEYTRTVASAAMELLENQREDES